MSATENKAVFLSYASQDAAAAQRICEALRAAGVEVWFDQNELVGGDVWDAKIRKQIAECALFVPIISANTQARKEGYFRLEWKLAAQRTHMMSEQIAFLLPVIIDGTREAEADVPGEFRAVQFTKLPGGETSPAFGARVQKLLGGSAGLQPARESAERGLKPRATPEVRRRMPALAWIGAAAAVALGGLYFVLRPEKGIGAGSAPNASGKTGSNAAMGSAGAQSAAPLSPARQLVEKARPLVSEINANRAKLDAAAELLAQAVAADPQDAAAWGLWAQVDSHFNRWSMDRSNHRMEEARRKATRSLSLDPESRDGLLGQAMALAFSRTDAARREAELGLKRMLGLYPEDPEALVRLAEIARFEGRKEESFALCARVMRIPGHFVLGAENLGLNQYLSGDLDAALATLDRVLAEGPFWQSLRLKAQIESGWTGNLAAAAEAVDKLPSAILLEDFAASAALQVFRFRREHDRSIQLLRVLPRDDLNSNILTGPRNLFLGDAQAMAGRGAAATVAWTEALQTVERKLAAKPGEPFERYWRAALLARLGQTQEARKEYEIVEQLYNGRVPQWVGWASTLHQLGRTEEVLDILEKALAAKSVPPTNLAAEYLRHDPYFDAFRSLPRFLAILAKAEVDPRFRPIKPRASAAADSSSGGSAEGNKSIAVLAFDNRSEDKDAEFFSDGISEELINALGRVPGLTVKGRTSAFFFKGKQVKSEEIGQQLGVAYLVRGSVRRAGGKVRITAQLSRAATDEVVWSSESMERELKDVFAVQDEIVGLIAKNLSVSLGVAARAPHQVNPEALTALMEGRHYWVLRTTEGFARARELFTRAVALDPQWAPARAALANLLTIEASFLKGGGGSFAELIAAGAREARKAIELDASLGEPHAALGKIAMEEGRLAEAEQEFRRALALEPNNALVRDWYGDLAVTQGRLDVAIAEYRRALELEPLSPYIQWDLAWELMHVRRYGEALTLVERATALTPNGSARLALRRARLLLEVGRPAEAEARAALHSYLEGRRTGSDPQFANEAVYCLRALASPAEREQRTADLLRLYPDSFASGVILLMQGQEEKAYPLLEKTPAIFWQQLYWDPVFDAVRDTPRFQQLLEKLGCAAEYKVARETQARLLKEYGTPR